jgi:predicted DNA-binding ribbon-helix-helix protein
LTITAQQISAQLEKIAEKEHITVPSLIEKLVKECQSRQTPNTDYQI